MSEWAYRECGKCGKRVHINHTCAKWGNKNVCDGDPWEEIPKIKSEIIKLEKQSADLVSVIVKIDSRLELLKNDL